MKPLKSQLRIDERVVDEDEAKLFDRVYSALADSSKARLIFRGESKKKLFRLYNSGGPLLFNKYFFIIGEKGKWFLTKIEEKGKENNWKLQDANEPVFRSIFEALSAISKNASPLFETQNKSLVTFFRHETNLERFCGTISPLNYNVRIRYRDYYLTLIHQFEDEVFYPVSSMLSVTTDFGVAKGFAGDSTDSLIMLGWIPRERLGKEFAARFGFLNDCKNELQAKGLPFCTTPFYPGETELTLKGGFLPHYILGYYYFENDTKEVFEINPNILSLRNNQDSWIESGLPIDQTEFYNVLKRTGYERGFWVNSDGEHFSDNVDIQKAGADNAASRQA